MTTEPDNGRYEVRWTATHWRRGFKIYGPRPGVLYAYLWWPRNSEPTRWW